MSLVCPIKSVQLSDSGGGREITVKRPLVSAAQTWTRGWAAGAEGPAPGPMQLRTEPTSALGSNPAPPEDAAPGPGGASRKDSQEPFAPARLAHAEEGRWDEPAGSNLYHREVHLVVGVGGLGRARGLWRALGLSDSVSMSRPEESARAEGCSETHVYCGAAAGSSLSLGKPRAQHQQRDGQTPRGTHGWCRLIETIAQPHRHRETQATAPRNTHTHRHTQTTPQGRHTRTKCKFWGSCIDRARATWGGAPADLPQA